VEQLVACRLSLIVGWVDDGFLIRVGMGRTLSGVSHGDGLR
jgi:hypothetical protein